MSYIQSFELQIEHLNKLVDSLERIYGWLSGEANSTKKSHVSEIDSLEWKLKATKMEVANDTFFKEIDYVE